MSFNTFGKYLDLLPGESPHGPAIGCIIDGCPPNIDISENDIQKDMDEEDLANQNLQPKEKSQIR